MLALPPALRILEKYLNVWIAASAISGDKTNALKNAANIPTVQEWLGRAHPTTRLYDRPKIPPENRMKRR